MSFFNSPNFNAIQSIVHAYFENPDKSIRNIMLYGIPGSGKTFAIKELCKQQQYELRIVSQNTVNSPFGGQTEVNIKKAIHGNNTPHVTDLNRVVCLIDEIDAINGYSLNILINIIDSQPHNIFFIATTNLLSFLNPQLLRHGRFDIEIHMEPLTRQQRITFLKFNHIKEDVLINDVLLPLTNGCVYADMVALLRLININETIETIKNNVQHHFKPALLRNAVEFVDQSTLECPQIIGYQDIKSKISKYILQPYNRSDKTSWLLYRQFNLRPIKGLLLYGPPGCSKTQFAKYIAFKLQCRLFTISCAQIISPYAGEGERKLRALFNRARLAGPSVLFFDEMEALLCKRGGRGVEGFQEKLITTFLTEMDGIESCRDVLIVGCTNRIEDIDTALIRPGRIDKILYIGKPDGQTRYEILQYYAKLHCIPKNKINNSIFMALSDKLDGFSGAQLQGMMKAFVLEIVIKSDEKHQYDMDDFEPFILQFKRKETTFADLNTIFQGLCL